MVESRPSHHRWSAGPLWERRRRQLDAELAVPGEGKQALDRSGLSPQAENGGAIMNATEIRPSRTASGQTELVTNCMVLTEGWDQPEVSCCILARPTKKMGLYRQMVGRVLRPAPGKIDAIVLDHSGAVFQHGFVEDHVAWTLDIDKRAHSPTHTDRPGSGHNSRLLECSQCNEIRTAGEPCRNCGFLPKVRGEPLVFRNGDLALVDRKTRTVLASSDPNERMKWHAMLTYIAAERGYRPGWAAHKYKEKFGTWPPVHTIQPMRPTLEVLAWVRSRMIAYAKSRQKETAA
jgi:DNA repair protein RadD